MGEVMLKTWKKQVQTREIWELENLIKKNCVFLNRNIYIVQKERKGLN